MSNLRSNSTDYLGEAKAIVFHLKYKDLLKDDDLLQECCVAVWNAENNWSSKRKNVAKLSTLKFIYVKKCVLDYFKKLNRFKNKIVKVNLKITQKAVSRDNPTSNAVFNEYVAWAKANLNRIKYKIFKSICINGLNFSKTARSIGMTKAGVRYHLLDIQNLFLEKFGESL